MGGKIAFEEDIVPQEGLYTAGSPLLRARPGHERRCTAVPTQCTGVYERVRRSKQTGYYQRYEVTLSVRVQPCDRARTTMSFTVRY